MKLLIHLLKFLLILLTKKNVLLLTDKEVKEAYHSVGTSLAFRNRYYARRRKEIESQSAQHSVGNPTNLEILAANAQAIKVLNDEEEYSKTSSLFTLRTKLNHLYHSNLNRTKHVQ